MDLRTAHDEVTWLSFAHVISLYPLIVSSASDANVSKWKTTWKIFSHLFIRMQKNWAALPAHWKNSCGGQISFMCLFFQTWKVRKSVQIRSMGNSRGSAFFFPSTMFSLRAFTTIGKGVFRRHLMNDKLANVPYEPSIDEASASSSTSTTDAARSQGERSRRGLGKGAPGTRYVFKGYHVVHVMRSDYFICIWFLPSHLNSRTP